MKKTALILSGLIIIFSLILGFCYFAGYSWHNDQAPEGSKSQTPGTSSDNHGQAPALPGSHSQMPGTPDTHEQTPGAFPDGHAPTPAPTGTGNSGQPEESVKKLLNSMNLEEKSVSL